MSKQSSLFAHGLLLMFLIFLFLPLYLAVIAASHEAKALMQAPIPWLPGSALFHNLKVVLGSGLAVTGGEPLWVMLLNSLVMAMAIALGKIILALTSAYALVYFEFPAKKTAFVLIFLTMMLPVEVRIIPTFQVVSTLGWVNSYWGLTLPLLASATATFLFRQAFKVLPAQLFDAARLDGAGPWRFFVDILLPLVRPQMAALFVILFVYGWNQYLWPLLITTETEMATIVMGIRYLAGVADQIPQWHYIMSMALIALIPPCIVVLLMQPWFEKGLQQEWQQ